jgi:hypothetical protein
VQAGIKDKVEGEVVMRGERGVCECARGREKERAREPPAKEREEVKRRKDTR